MKKICIGALLLCCTGAAFSQRQVPIVLNVYGGYTFPDHVPLGYYNNYNSYGSINGSGQWGAGLEFFVDKLRALELSYQYMGTHMPFYNWEGQTNSGNDKCTIQYIMLGGNNYVPTHGNLMPYAGVGLGVGLMNYTYYNGYSENLTKFAWNIHLGVKVKTESAVSIKLQAYLQSIAQGVGVGVGFGTGGAGAGVTTYSSMLQFGLGGAICFALGGKGSGGHHSDQ
ncbi:MAG TPA: hypothetical protein VGQ51_03055 [Puia sp.]|jgi:opacity protein-like surface antigen|nr:hypothetical protein [Puia sp.]